jgi:peptidoglycan hydrolase CwlO-like protein
VASVLLAIAALVPATAMAHAASAESVHQKLARARVAHQAARASVGRAHAHLGELLEAYRSLQAKLFRAAADVVAAYANEQDLSEQLAAAQERLNERVTVAYELGPGATVDLFLGAQSPGDFASAQVFAANTFQLDEAAVAEVANLKTSLAATVATLEARQHELDGSLTHLQALADVAAADLADARAKAAAAGLAVNRLEQKERALELARAQAAAALKLYLGSGGTGEGCASGAVHDLIVKAFVPQGQAQVDMALAVATRESNCRPEAYNRTEVPPYGNASGVFQILTPGIWEPWAAQCGHKGASPFDAAANIAVAACVVAADGWWPWGF